MSQVLVHKFQLTQNTLYSAASNKDLAGLPTGLAIRLKYVLPPPEAKNIPRSQTKEEPPF
ncbi:hypothetical protein NQ317_002644 [Molorchus minor]|uniref:Uncharacterized protein n=1 Tax=Molorchus minor TaxID=1323400 RepID=A0ABQ9J9P1_9CUCU|nr:hypothetical protein NQ317_002644 [Molorchus minor]